MMMLRTGLARLGKAHDDAILAQYYPVLLEAYRNDIDRHTVLYPGAMQAVADLKALGFGVGICTNKPEALADLLLRKLHIRDEFAALIGADTLSVRKPDPEPLFETARRCGADPSDCCLIGDSDTDRNTAKAAGVPSILVTFGPSGADMEALQPEGLLSDFADLPALVQALMG